MTANVVVVDLAASRDLAHRMNTVRDVARHPDRLVHPGALNAMRIIDEVTHLVLSLFRERRDPRVMLDALGWLEARVGRDALDATLLAFADQLPSATGTSTRHLLRQRRSGGGRWSPPLRKYLTSRARKDGIDAAQRRCMDIKQELLALSETPASRTPALSVFLETHWVDEQQRDRVRAFVE